MGKSRRKVVTVKPVNTEADWDEMCARKVKHMEYEIVIYEFNQHEWNIFRQNLNELEIVMVPVSCAKPIKQSHYKIISTVKSVILDAHSNITICQIITQKYTSLIVSDRGHFWLWWWVKMGHHYFLLRKVWRWWMSTQSGVDRVRPCRPPLKGQNWRSQSCGVDVVVFDEGQPAIMMASW